MPEKTMPTLARPMIPKPYQSPVPVKELEAVGRLQGLMHYNMLVFKSTFLPFANELAELTKLDFNAPPAQAMLDWAERQQSAINFHHFIHTFGVQLFGSAKFEGERLLAENDLFTLTYIPVKAGVERKASMFHVGGFVPYSDNLFRLLPEANFFDRFIEKGIDVYEMKLKCRKDCFNPHLLQLSVARIVETVHNFSDIAFEHNGRRPMILEGYCGTGINTYTSYLADMENMARKFNLILTFVSPVDGRKCTIFEEMHRALNLLNPDDSNVDGMTISSVLDTVQDRNFEKTPLGAMWHGWKNKEYARVEKIEDLTPRQRSEIAAWYWLSVQHGSYYPLSRDLYRFYAPIFARGVTDEGVLPYVHEGRVLNLKDLKKTKVKVLAFLGDKDNLVDQHTADVLHPLLGKQCEVVVHEKTGHVAYIFNPSRWRPDDKRAFKPDVIGKIFEKLGIQ